MAASDAGGQLVPPWLGLRPSPTGLDGLVTTLHWSWSWTVLCLSQPAYMLARAAIPLQPARRLGKYCLAVPGTIWWKQARTQDFRKGGGPDPKEGPTQTEGPPAPLKGPCGHAARISFKEGYVSFEATGAGGAVGKLSNYILSMQRHRRNVNIPFKHDSFHATP